MATRPPDRQRHATAVLFADLNQIEFLRSNVDRVAADLTDAESRAFEEMGMILDQVDRAVHRPGLLIGQDRQDDVAG